MNFLSKLSLSGLILASSASMAYEPSDGWYGGLMAGVSMAPGITFKTTNPAPPPTTFKDQLSYKVGANGGGQIGYRCYKLRYEGQIMFNYDPISKLAIPGGTIRTKFSPTGISLKGYTDFPAALFNVFYEFYDGDYYDTNWVPYLGLGIGYSTPRTVISYYLDRTKIGHTSSSSTTPIGQAMFGFGYFFSNDMSLGADLRYMLTRKISHLDARISVVTLNAVFNYSFDGLY